MPEQAKSSAIIVMIEMIYTANVPKHKFYIDETTITESLAIHVDDEIMEYDGRDYNKKACFSIVKKIIRKAK